MKIKLHCESFSYFLPISTTFSCCAFGRLSLQHTHYDDGKNYSLGKFAIKKCWVTFSEAEMGEEEATKRC